MIVARPGQGGGDFAGVGSAREAGDAVRDEASCELSRAWESHAVGRGSRGIAP